MFSLANCSILSTILSKSGERGHPCLLPDLKENVSRFCPFNMILAVGLS